jgi:hypothetical protein
MFEKLLQITVVIFFSCFDSPSQATLTDTSATASTDTDSKEKRDICRFAMENVIEFWRHLYILISLPVSSIEKAYFKDHSSYSNYDPVTFKRHNLVLLSRYLAQVFTCQHMYTLPAPTIKSLLDVLFAIVKALQDAKKMPSLKHLSAEAKDSQAPPLFGFGPSLARAPSGSIGRRVNSFSFGY